MLRVFWKMGLERPERGLRRLWKPFGHSANRLSLREMNVA
jgi:hypothetical protein